MEATAISAQTRSDLEAMLDRFAASQELIARERMIGALCDMVSAVAFGDFARAKESFAWAEAWGAALAEWRWYREHGPRALDRWADDGGRA